MFFFFKTDGFFFFFCSQKYNKIILFFNDYGSDWTNFQEAKTELTKLASINLKVSSPKSELVLFAQTTTRQMRTDVFLETVCPEIWREPQGYDNPSAMLQQHQNSLVAPFHTCDVIWVLPSGSLSLCSITHPHDHKKQIYVCVFV